MKMSQMFMTPATWPFLAVMMLAALLSLYFLLATGQAAIGKFQDWRDQSDYVFVHWGDIIANAIGFAIPSWIAWQCYALARVTATGKGISTQRIVVLAISLVVAGAYCVWARWQAKENCSDSDDISGYLLCHRMLKGTIVAAVVLALAIPVAALAGDFRFGEATNSDQKKVKEIALNTKEERLSNGEDDTFAPSNLDDDQLIEKWYGKYQVADAGAICRQPFYENDTVRDAQAEYKRPVMFKYTDPNNKDLTYKETIEAILYSPTYAGGMAEFLTEFDRIREQNQDLVAIAKEHRERYDTADGVDPDGLQYSICRNPNTNQDELTRDAQRNAAIVCEVFSKFTYGGVEARQTKEQWGLPIKFETQEDIPVGAQWQYRVGSTVENPLRYMKKYTAAEEQDSLPAVIWSFTNADDSKIVFGTGADNKNFRIFDEGSKNTSTKTKVTTETYDPGNPGNPGNPDNPSNPPQDPPTDDPEDPPTDDPEDPPATEPAKNPTKDPVNPGNAPTGGGDNDPGNTTGNDNSLPYVDRQEGGGGSNVTTPSTGNNNGGQTAKPDGTGTDGVKSDGGISSGVTSGHVPDVPQTSTSGEQVSGGTPPSAPASKPTQNTQTTVTTTVTDGNGNTTQNTSDASNTEHSGFVTPD